MTKHMDNSNSPDFPPRPDPTFASHQPDATFVPAGLDPRTSSQAPSTEKASVAVERIFTADNPLIQAVIPDNEQREAVVNAFTNPAKSMADLLTVMEEAELSPVDQKALLKVALRDAGVPEEEVEDKVNKIMPSDEEISDVEEKEVTSGDVERAKMFLEEVQKLDNESQAFDPDALDADAGEALLKQRASKLLKESMGINWAGVRKKGIKTLQIGGKTVVVGGFIFIALIMLVAIMHGGKRR